MPVVSGVPCTLERSVNYNEAVVFVVLDVVGSGLEGIRVGCWWRWDVIDSMSSPVERECREGAHSWLFPGGVMYVGDWGGGEVGGRIVDLRL